MFKNIIFLAILLITTSCSSMYPNNPGVFRQKNTMQTRGYYIADEHYLEDDYDDPYQEDVREERYPVYRESYPVREEVYEYEYDNRHYHHHRPHSHHRNHCTHGSVPREHQQEDCPRKSYHMHGFYRR